MLLTPLVLAQKQPNPRLCGTPDLTEAQRRILDYEAKLALANKQANNAPTAITYVP